MLFTIVNNAQTTVVDVIVNSPDHNTLEAAVIAADLAGALSGDGPFTVFAPTDDAFAALPDGTIDALLADPAGALTDILTYHVLAADVRSTDLVDGQTAVTLNGKEITVTINNMGVFINDAQVTVADIVTDNGVVHVIDAVLIPTTSSTFENENSFGSFDLFPNPAADLLNIRVENSDVVDSRISIIDLGGRLVKTLNISTTNMQIEISDIEKGMYILELKNLNSRYQKKFIKL